MWVQREGVQFIGLSVPDAWAPPRRIELANSTEHPPTPMRPLSVECTTLRTLNMPSLRTLLLAIGMTGLVGASTSTAFSETFKLSGRVMGASGKSVIYVALWQADGFLVRPAQTRRIAIGEEAVFHFELPARGRWAISAFEDRNGNGTLDMGTFGPEEPSGFWRPFSAPRRPEFGDVDTLINRDIANANVTLK
jgi:uncharacterized protein (DUF2141 family)